MPIRITVVIPVYNGQKYLKRSLNALLSQTVRPTEIIIVNDASTDDTPLIAQAYQRRYPKLIRLIHNPENRGINYSLNRCIFKEVKNDYIFPTACDDMVLSDFIEKSLNAIAMKPQAGITFSNTHNVQEQRLDELLQDLKADENPSPSVFYSPDELVMHIQKDLSIPTNTMVINRKLAYDAGGYIETLKWHADLMLAYVLAFRYGAVFIPQNIAIRTFRDDSYSAVHVDIEKNVAIYNEFLTLIRTRYRDCFEAFIKSNFFKIWHYRIAEGIIRTPSMWNVDNLRLCINQLLQWATLANDNVYGVFLEEILNSPKLYLEDHTSLLNSDMFAISCLNALKADVYELDEVVYKSLDNIIKKGYSVTALKILQRRLTKERHKQTEESYYSTLLTLEHFISQANLIYQQAINALIYSNDYKTAERLLDDVYLYFKDEVNVLLFKAFLCKLKGQKQFYEEFRLRAETFAFNSIFSPAFKEIEAELLARL